MTDTIKLGNKVKDVVSGFTGIVTARMTSLNGMVQYVVRPPQTKDKPDILPDAQFFDYQQLKIMTGGLKDIISNIVQTDIELGTQVEDIVTGFKGTAIAKMEFTNGCLQICIKPKMSKKDKDEGKMPEGEWVDSNQIKIVSKGTNTIKKTIDAKKDKDDPGGDLSCLPRL